MDNEGLLKWAVYEVNSVRGVLKRAELNRGELRKVVKAEKDKEAYDIDALTLKVCEFIKEETARIREKNVFETIHGISLEEYYGCK